MSCTCQSCGSQYKVDVNIPDDLWEQIRPDKSKPKESGLMCGPCIFQRIEALNHYDAFELKPIADKTDPEADVPEYTKDTDIICDQTKLQCLCASCGCNCGPCHDIPSDDDFDYTTCNVTKCGGHDERDPNDLPHGRPM
jgi:hypothetical protein